MKITLPLARKVPTSREAELLEVRAQIVVGDPMTSDVHPAEKCGVLGHEGTLSPGRVSLIPGAV